MPIRSECNTTIEASAIKSEASGWDSRLTSDEQESSMKTEASTEIREPKVETFYNIPSSDSPRTIKKESPVYATPVDIQSEGGVDASIKQVGTGNSVTVDEYRVETLEKELEALQRQLKRATKQFKHRKQREPELKDRAEEIELEVFEQYKLADKAREKKRAIELRRKTAENNKSHLLAEKDAVKNKLLKSESRGTLSDEEKGVESLRDRVKQIKMNIRGAMVEQKIMRMVPNKVDLRVYLEQLRHVYKPDAEAADNRDEFDIGSEASSVYADSETAESMLEEDECGEEDNAKLSLEQRCSTRDGSHESQNSSASVYDCQKRKRSDSEESDVLDWEDSVSRNKRNRSGASHWDSWPYLHADGGSCIE